MGQKDHSWFLPALVLHSQWYKDQCSQQAPCGCEHSPTDHPEASSLGGLAERMDTHLVPMSTRPAPIPSINTQRGWLWKQSPP